MESKQCTTFLLHPQIHTHNRRGGEGFMGTGFWWRCWSGYIHLSDSRWQMRQNTVTAHKSVRETLSQASHTQFWALFRPQMGRGLGLEGHHEVSSYVAVY